MADIYPYPVFLNLEGRPCLVVGGGPVAARKVADLIEAGATVTVVADHPHPDLVRLTGEDRIVLAHRAFVPEDIDGAFLVFAATDNREVNAAVAGHTRQHGAIVNAVDDPPNCDFFSGAVVARGPLRIAISTSGRSPGVAAAIKRSLEETYDERYASYVEAIGTFRRRLIEQGDMGDSVREHAIRWLAGEEARTIYFTAGTEELWAQLRRIISI